jgi:hypothetical protein
MDGAREHVCESSLTLSPRGVSVPAYIVVETDIHDPEQYERHKQASPAAVASS